MDFGYLLDLAKHNEAHSKVRAQVKRFDTSLQAPKRSSKQKVSKDAIKKVLQKKEIEERKKQSEERKKKEELLSLRDKNKDSKNRVSKMLRLTKSSNKSVLEDACNDKDTAVTLAGPLQPDEDDYGYTSRESSAMYEKLLAKYNSAPDGGIISKSVKKTAKDIDATKARVKEALKEEIHGSRKARSSKKKIEDDSDGPEEEWEKKGEKEKPKQKPKPPAPPPMSFRDLLKIAETKQHEPVVVEKKVEEVKECEFDRPMTAREKEDYVREMNRKLQQEGKPRLRDPLPAKQRGPGYYKNFKEKSTLKKSADPEGKVQNGGQGSKPQTSQMGRIEDEKRKEHSKKIMEEEEEEAEEQKEKISSRPEKQRPQPPCKQKPSLQPPIPPSIQRKKPLSPPPVQRKKLPVSPTSVKKLPAPPLHREKQIPPPLPTQRQKLQVSSGNSSLKRRPQSPPPARSAPPEKKIIRALPKKGRIESDEEDEDLSDFIDDGPEEEEDYSKHIREIFGYDKRRYTSRRVEDSDSDECMESNFHDVMREEIHSTKMGILEDLADIRREKKLKQLKKSKKL